MLRFVRCQSQAAKGVIITDKFGTLRERYEAPRYPVVLCHGFSGFDQLGPKAETIVPMRLDYWRGIKEALQQIGLTVLIAKVPAFGTIAARAALLNAFIDAQCRHLRHRELKRSLYNNAASTATFADKGARIKVNLIAHSMGGLDSRYLISKLEHPLYQIVSLTTVLTPHHGSECADFLVDVAAGPLGRALPALVLELTTEALRRFNRDTPNDPTVAYFSYGARFRPRWYNVFKPTWEIIRSRMHGDNDGVVSVESAKWGEYLGTLDEVDHLDLINWTNRARVAVDKALFRKEPKFNAVALYLDIADNLRKRGF